MKIGPTDLDEEVLLIAEIGNNHEGDVQLAEKLINLAAEAGAHVAKLQTMHSKRLVHDDDPAVHRLDRFELTRKDYEHLALVADKANIMFMSTPFSIEAVDWLNELVPAFKVSSADNDFDPLLKKIAETAKPVVLSTGMCAEKDVDHACDVLRETWSKKSSSPGLALLQCVTAYPAPFEDVNLATINALKTRSDAVGYSDHTLGIDAAVLSVAAGARIVEKHFTIDKNYSDFRDHALSADPQELKRLATRIIEVSSAFGTKKKNCLKSESALAVAARRSIVAKDYLPAGKVICIDDLDWLRPADGLSPRFTGQVVGRRLKHALARGDRLNLDILD